MRPSLPHEPRIKSRSIGFPKSNSSIATTASIPSSRPATNYPAPGGSPAHARKGRWFVSLVIASLIGFVAVACWNEFFRFQAYGQLEGTVVHLASAAKGTVRAVNFEEGDWVEAGQLLVELDVRELEFQRLRASQQLQVAVSDLKIRLAELSSRDLELRSVETDRLADYYELLGQLNQRQSELEELKNTFRQNEKLKLANAISDSEFVAAKTAVEGQQALIDQLTLATEALKSYVGQLPPRNTIEELMRSEELKIAKLRSQIKSIDDLLQEKFIRAPVTGRVLKRLAEPGEHLPANSAVLEMVESGSVEAVVYLPQQHASTLAIGDSIRLKVTPLGTSEIFEVKRFSPEIVTPPNSIKSNYRAFKGLVRVYAVQVRPEKKNGNSPEAIDLTSWVGAELSLPSFGYRTGTTQSENDCRENAVKPTENCAGS